MKTSDIRDLFLKYFRDKEHAIVRSSSLVPDNDDSLLFTNSGMVQFKDIILGKITPSLKRVVTCQRCVRAGGKHNDLENVGYTDRHHTFFEMLGNFSFGDYFKEDSIKYAWEFLTEELKLPRERLSVSVYRDDQESYEIWRDVIGIPSNKISFLGDDDNFWSMGDTGPCGPCTEIFFDGTEIWNLVFMQHNRLENGELEDLPMKCVDTGMGLERISAVMQNVKSNFDTGLFKSLIHSIGMSLESYGRKDMRSMRVISDHIRSASFMILDGVTPSNERRGYVLRRILRRAIRHGHRIGHREPFLYALVTPLCEQMGDAYPELLKDISHVKETILAEEIKFSKTLTRGIKLFNKKVNRLEGDTIPGEVAFTLYDTFGFPLDLTMDMAKEKELKVDQEGFDECMKIQKERSRKK